MDDIILKIAATAIITGATSAAAVVAALKVHIVYLKAAIELQYKNHGELAVRVGVIENEVAKLNVLRAKNESG
ncbi:hypothetical protein FHG08_11495 [Pseudoalteromonas sp. Scap03]|uniref:hypothetical protein n=1 Tax=unclassified Pseudoalteromonas TaxID=194690 RepID=UPI0015C1B96A|nr:MULTISPECIES: hypothetical protein [unclassified Pseudoalteromonas]NWL16315.1 hypothetical protein [Pseudoalteromonas sp. Scap03]QLE81433.1 hypothetical protein FLM54_07750 [Pseudoalteromonas sp. Scap25]QLE89377.1 hypothetical protein FLM47_07745 [Pseudoalteromonas sp. Scap06]